MTDEHHVPGGGLQKKIMGIHGVAILYVALDGGNSSAAKEVKNSP
jgi:hypothetical protein